MNKHLLSVIIPTFNRAHVLTDALDSIFAQGVADVQVVIVDDGSTDETREVVGRYGKPLDYVFQENQGAAAARNRGLELARGEFISFLDSDDVWLPGKTDAEMSVFERMPEVGAVVSDSEYWTENEFRFGSRYNESGVYFDTDAPRILTPETPFWLGGCVFSTCCLTMRRGALERVGGFDASFECYEDWDYEIRLFHACRVAALPRVLARVRRFDDGTRRGRALPGRTPTTEQARRLLVNRHRVLEKTLRLPTLSAESAACVRERMRELAAEIARTRANENAVEGNAQVLWT
ncbi:MAG TPA: glycosyltransferase [Pyrinomonadaceae bacterium]|nr:glycosyltransferase [Pyrinomonadaceae bacterium]